MRIFGSFSHRFVRLSRPAKRNAAGTSRHDKLFEASSESPHGGEVEFLSAGLGREVEREREKPSASGADLGRESHGERSEHDVARLHLFGAKMFNPMVDGKPFAFCPGHGSGVTGNKRS